MTDPKAIPEQLDAAADGAEFADVLNRLFRVLEKARDEDE